jgi:hypothetical protein
MSVSNLNRTILCFIRNSINFDCLNSKPFGLADLYPPSVWRITASTVLDVVPHSITIAGRHLPCSCGNLPEADKPRQALNLGTEILYGVNSFVEIEAIICIITSDLYTLSFTK